MPKSHEFQATVNLGQQLNQIENRDDLNPEEKVALYGHQLHRYKNYLHQAREQGKEWTPTGSKTKKQENIVSNDGAAAAAAAAPKILLNLNK